MTRADGAGDDPAPLNLHLHHLAYLRAVARHGTLSRAAASLQVSQPALSQALAQIERRLGAPVFERAGRQRRPTAAGAELLRFAEEVLARAEALRRRLRAYREGAAGPLALGMIDAVGLYVLPDVVRRFREEHPAVDLTIVVADSVELVARLRAFALDLAFVVGPVHEPDLSATEVLREPLHVYRPAQDADDPHRARWVLYPRGSRTRRIIDDALARRGIRPAVTLESGNPQVLRQMVAFGLGWSVLPPAVGENEPAHGSVRRGERLAERPLVAVRRRAGPPDARVEAFLHLALAATAAATRPPSPA
jgi:DNA-binding transcriptional LysR family regulator